MSRRVSVLVAVLCVVALVAILIAAVGYGFMPKDIEMHPFEPGTRPEGAALELTMPEADDAEGAIAFTAKLYDIACQNYQESEKACFMVKSSTLMFGSINVEGHRYCVKDGDKRYYVEYSFVDGNAGPMGAIVGLFDTKYVMAQYTDATMDEMIEKRASTANDKLAPSYVLNEDGTYQYTADYEKIGLVTSMVKKPNYAAYQEGKFQHTDHCVSVDTILTSTVTYNAEEGYYHFEFTLDTTKVPEELLNSLRESSGAADASYTDLTQTMEIWDNGYFRSYRAMDSWAGKMGGALALTSVLDFSTTYYYEDQYMDISNYQYMSELCTPEE